PLRAADCRAEAKFKDVLKEARAAAAPGGAHTAGGRETLEKGRTAGARPGVGTPEVYDVHWDVEVSGCPASAGRPHKFAKASYGTITYKLKKRDAKGAALEEQRTENWSDDDKVLALTSKIEGKDAQGGLFEVTGAEVVRTVCGCN